MSSFRVLVLSRNYPNEVIPQLGLWVEGLVRHLGRVCETRVIAPVPYCPPLPGFSAYTRFRRIPSADQVNGIEVMHPRFLTGPGYSLHSLEASTYYWGIRHRVEQLRRKFPFDLIHAHFSYPDGVVAARLGRQYRLPVVITEHAPWLPWMEEYPRVRHQAMWASAECSYHIAVSRYVRDTVVHFTGETKKLHVIPVGVDGSVFTACENGQGPLMNQVLFVGAIRPVKGLDILIKAMRLLSDRGRKLKLLVVGESFYQSYRREYQRIQQMVHELRLTRHVEFVGRKSPSEIVQYLHQSALLVLPSRAESFGAVLVEALVCGTPVLATRCGGPEDIVTDDVGVLVTPEDERALAEGIEHIIRHRSAYDATRLRQYALQRFSWEKIVNDTVCVYREALDVSGSEEARRYCQSVAEA